MATADTECADDKNHMRRKRSFHQVQDNKMVIKCSKHHVNTSPVTAHPEYEDTDHVREELHFPHRHDIPLVANDEQGQNGFGEGSDRSSPAREGIFEAEICREELDLHTHMDTCQKNPGHKGFIPVKEFTVRHLPAQYQDHTTVQFIKALADLTVRVSVKYTSTERPDCYPGTTKPFPAAQLKGTRTSTQRGSGWVSRVDIHQSLDFTYKNSCPCQECRGRKRPRKTWASVLICTSAHVVYDKNEAAYTTCHLFYDTNGTSLDDIPSLHGATLLGSNVDSDYCWIEYITHDIDLAEKLKTKVKLYSSLREHAYKKYVGECHGNKLAVIVSHPHGCSKHISVGELVKEVKCDDWDTRYTYTTPTCPGSSGALVLPMSRDLLFDRPHFGHCEDNLNLNYSRGAMR